MGYDSFDGDDFHQDAKVEYIPQVYELLTKIDEALR